MGGSLAEPGFLDYGGRRSFSGPISTVRAPEDNSLVRKALEEPGQGRVLVVDGGGSRRCALVGDQLAALAQKNGWAGVVVNGCIRDAEEVGRTAIGVKALGTHPRVTFRPGHYLYADADGIVTSETALS